MNFEQQIATYAEAVSAFRVEHDLPAEWFAQPDHVAIKCAGSADYEAVVQTWLPKAAELHYAHLNGRRLASARLLGPILVGNLGSVEWLEIMEPRPEKAGMGPVGVDHMEFDFGDFESAMRTLQAKNVPFEQQENPNHQWLSIVANGHEFKLNSRTLADVVQAEIASGTAIVLK